MNQTEPANLTDEIHFTPQELGKVIKLHPDTVIKIFRDEPGVVRVGHGPGRLRRDKETGRLKPVRQYFSLRIPKRVADIVLRRLSVKPRGGKTT
jgi:hypothetical protein